MTARKQAEQACYTHYADDSEATDDERDAFIAGYLRARADACNERLSQIDAIDRLVGLADNRC